MDEAKGIKDTTQTFFSSKVKDLKVSSIANPVAGTTLLGKLNLYKEQLIDKAIHNNTTVNMGICDYVLGEMNKIYQNPGFQTSVIVLMFLLLYGFVRIVFWVMTGIAFVVFKALFVAKIYRFHTVTKEVDELE